MKSFLFKLLSFTVLLGMLSGCGRDLSSSTYTSESTLSFTLEGVVVSARPVVIKEHDKLQDNQAGMLAGGVLGAAAGLNAGGGTGKAVTTVGGALLGGLAGATIEQKLSQNQGLEYIIKVDASKIKDDGFYGSYGNPAVRNVISSARLNGLITVVQGADNPVSVGQKVYAIFSDNRTRVIPAM